MRSGKWIAALAGVIALVAPGLEARADGLFHHTIPRETPALDYRTGDVMMAPPIPGGHYTKDLTGTVHGAAGMTFGAIHGLAGKLHGAKGLLHGNGLHGDGSGCAGDGCGHGSHGDGLGLGGLGHGNGNGLFGGLGHGNGLGLGHGNGNGLLGGLGHGGGLGGLGHGSGSGGCFGPGCSLHHASPQATPAAPAKAVVASPQVMASSQQAPSVCGGCLGLGLNGQGRGCGLCGGTGRLRNLFGRGGQGLCGGCGGQGCGACGGRGLLGGQGLCGGCGGQGCGACGGRGNGLSGLCRGCGGQGCGLCGHLAGLKGKAHSLLGLPRGLAAKALHKGQVQYFVGPGGPVPLTPGYVPYVVTTRSPRDFLAFPPFSEQIP